MSEYRRQQGGYDCPPLPKDPAGQPHPPGTTKCSPIPPTTPPTFNPPEPCPPDPTCHCPGGGGGSDSNCLEKLIARQAAEIAAAAKAASFKTDLEGILAKAKLATQDYTRVKYDALVQRWVDQDAAVAELIRKLVCALPCWKCVIECHICPLLNDLHYAEQQLCGDRTQYTDVHNLYDLLYWHSRNRDAKERQFSRIQAVLAAWASPAKTIDATLGSNQALIDAANKLVGTNPAAAVYDVFLKLVPLDLAIAPQAGSKWTTRISKEFTAFCTCDGGAPDDCCGPDVGELSLRQRLIGPQPYLIDPNEYYKVICCLVEERYHPAKDAFAKADADWAAVDAQIKSLKAKIDNGIKSFEQSAKGAIPNNVDCCNYEPEGGSDAPRQTSR
jgi:hypothetical protein